MGYYDHHQEAMSFNTGGAGNRQWQWRRAGGAPANAPGDSAIVKLGGR